MKALKIVVLGLALGSLAINSSCASVSNHRPPHHTEDRYDRRESPDERAARQMTESMARDLRLSSSQYDRVYKIALRYQRYKNDRKGLTSSERRSINNDLFKVLDRRQEEVFKRIRTRYGL